MKEEEEKYVNQLADEMLAWVYALNEEPVLLAAFFSTHRIPWFKFNLLKKKYPKLDSALQETCTELCVKWFNYVMKTKDLPTAREKLALSYVKKYDPQLWQEKQDQYQEMKKERAALYSRQLQEY